MAALPDNNTQEHTDVNKVYDQLCQTYRAIDDFRAKLLGFLPLASAGGAFLLLNDIFTDPVKSKAVQPMLKPLGHFGLIVTFGLYFYEIYGIRRCHALIETGKELERCLDIPYGQFTTRPPSVLYLINEPFATSLIYPAVMAGWVFLAQVFPQPASNQLPEIDAALNAAIVVFGIGFFVTVIYSLVLRYFYKNKPK